MIDRGSVSLWLHRLTAGDPKAFDPLWSRYYHRVVSLARTYLRRWTMGPVDEEDVAVSVFHQFYQAAASSRFARLENRDDLWQVLALLTTRKAVNYHKHQTRAKRFCTTVALSHEIASAAADPAAAALGADEVRALFELLPLETREVARLKLDGHSNEEIAARLGCTFRTVTRRLALIRSTWDHACS